VGILGLHDARGSVLAPTYPIMTAQYGTISGTYRTLLLALLKSEVALRAKAR